MKTADLIVNAAWVIPIVPKQTTLSDTSIAIIDGKIDAILPHNEILSNYHSEEIINLNSHALMPGLINAHTHAAMTLLRGYADDMPLMQWLNEHIWPAEARWIDQSFIEDGTMLAIAEMIQSGTTCFNDMYFYPDVVASCAEQVGIRASIGMIVLDFPTVWAENSSEYIEKGLQFRDAYRHSKLITAAFAPHAPYSVSDAPLEKIAMLAEELDVQLHIHVHESAQEIDESMARYGVRPIERLNRLGLLGNRLQAVHMTQLLDAEIESLAKHGVHVVHCPQSNLKLASGFCPLDALSKAGVSLALGTDGPASNNDLDMFAELQTASLLAKGVAGNAEALPAHQALEMATLGGARALGIDRQTGTLETGKWADMIAIDLSQLQTQPLYNPVSQIVYSAGRDCVTDSWVGGKRLLRDGQLAVIEKEELLEKAQNLARKMEVESHHRQVETNSQ